MLPPEGSLLSACSSAPLPHRRIAAGPGPDASCWLSCVLLCVALCVAQEVLLMQRGQETLYLTPRLGFVKLAMTHGVPLVPAFAFGVGFGCVRIRSAAYASQPASRSLHADGGPHQCSPLVGIPLVEGIL